MGKNARRKGAEVNGLEFAPSFLPDDPFDGEGAAAQARVNAEIESLGLERNIAELDRDGFTVLAPEQVAPLSYLNALRDEILRISGRRTGAPVDIETGKSHSDLVSPFGQVQIAMSLLLEGAVFEQALMNKPTLALITYMLGESCILNHLSSMVKGPGTEYLPIHVDQNRSGAQSPFPYFAQVANATWALTDYCTENGAICFVPGSHKLCRAPTFSEATSASLFRPLECPAGSVLIWHGNTWHGAVPRRAPGVRVSLVAYFSRWYYPPQENVSAGMTPEMLARNSERFAVLTGVAQPMWDHKSAKFNAGRYNLFA